MLNLQNCFQRHTSLQTNCEHVFCAVYSVTYPPKNEQPSNDGKQQPQTTNANSLSATYQSHPPIPNKNLHSLNSTQSSESQAPKSPQIIPSHAKSKPWIETLSGKKPSEKSGKEKEKGDAKESLGGMMSRAGGRGRGCRRWREESSAVAWKEMRGVE